MKRIVTVTLIIVVLIGLGLLTNFIQKILPPSLPPYEQPKQAMWLEQNWQNDSRHWFHHASQGTATLPISYDWFMALEQPELFTFSASPLFSEPTYLARFGFIPSPKAIINPNRNIKTSAEDFATQGYSDDRQGSYGVNYRDDSNYRGNPGGLPVGFALTGPEKITPGGDKTETNPVTNQNFEEVLGFTCAACHTGQMTYKGTNIRIDGGPATVNLDAFKKALAISLLYTSFPDWISGRFNRFAKRVLGENDSKEARIKLRGKLKALLEGLKAQQDTMVKHQKHNVEEGFFRLDALNRIGNQVFYTDMYQQNSFNAEKNIASTNAPVNYPHIWSTSWFDWVQYDASIMQPMIRNAGESLGVSAQINLVHPNGLYESSVLVEEIYQMEELLAGKDPLPAQRFRGLRAPQWPQNILGVIDASKAKQGELLYTELCQSCHLPPVSSDAFWSDKHWVTLPNAKGRYLKVEIVPLDEIGTDPAQAMVLPERMVEVPDFLNMPKFKIDGEGVICGGQPDTKTTESLFAWALAYVTQKAVEHRYEELGIDPAKQEIMNGNRPNCVRAPKAYKARPLNGIWATAPFLHNGSVLTLTDLLGSADQRPKKICLGDQEFDPVNVGLVGECKKGTTQIDTTVPGNLATGHSFENNAGKGVVGRALSDDERAALIEYLKTL